MLLIVLWTTTGIMTLSGKKVGKFSYAIVWICYMLELINKYLIQ